MKAAPIPRTRMNVSFPRFIFLSCAISVHQLVEGERGARNILDPGRQPDRGQMADGALGFGLGYKPLPRRREAERERHADGNRFAVQQPVGETARRFQRVAERVAEIEQLAVAGLALVARDDRGLGAAAHRDGVFARGTSGGIAAGEYVFPIGFEPGEEGGVAEQAVFGDFGVAGAEFALRQHVKQSRVGDNQDRLMESADEVLAVAGVDGGLAADRGIDLRQQRGRHLHVIEPAPHHRRGESGEIADDAAAERDDEIAALDARGDDGLADLFEDRKAFRPLAGRDDDAVALHAGLFKGRLGGRQNVARDVLVGDDESLGAGPQRGDARAKRSNNAAPDHDVVAARAELDFNDRGIAANGCGHAPSFRSGETGTCR